MKKLNILMITPFYKPNVGGVEVHIEDLCSFLVARGHRVVVITYQPLTERTRAPAMERTKGLEVRRIKWFGYNWFYKLEPYPVLQTLYVLPGLLAYTFAFLLANGKAVNVLHSHGYIASLACRVLKSFFKKKAVASIHTTYKLHVTSNPWLTRIFSWILKGFDRVLVISEEGRRELISYGVSDNKVITFTYWADDEQFKPLDKQCCKEKLGWEGKFVVLFVGRLVHTKGVNVLARASSMTDPSVHFAFITTGNLSDFLRVIGQDVLPNNIIYVGTVDHSKLHLYYNAADLLVVPSQKAEGFARVCIEAMLCGTPVLASNVGYLPEVINKDAGELISPPTAKMFAERINYYFYNRGELNKLSASCQKYARRRFTKNNALIIEETYYR